MIPKIIHYCWFGRIPLSSDALSCIESWKKFCPDYEIKEWNEDNYDLTTCSYVKQAVLAKKWAFVSDYARFDILSRYGGLYFDVDVELIRDISHLIENGSFMGCEQGRDCSESTQIASGLGIGAEPGLPIFDIILDSYRNDDFVFNQNQGVVETVVERVTRIFRKHGYVENGKTQIVEGVTIYPWDYLCPMNYYSGKTTITENTCAIHHYNMSWQSSYSKRMKKIEKFFRSTFGDKTGFRLYKCFSFPIKGIHKSYTLVKKRSNRDKY